MAFDFQTTSSPAIAQRLRQDSQSLSEKARRRLAALAASTRGHGALRSMAQVLGGDPHTMQDGRRARKQRPDDPAGSRVRTPGGGRKKTAGTPADVTQQVQDTIKNRTAGAPMRPNGVWTAGTPQEMAQSLQAPSVFAPPRLGRRMLDGLGVARRQMAKGVPGGDAPHRDAPFRPRAQLIQALLEAGPPVLRMETKKKAWLGTLYRDGTGDCHQALKACAHAVPRLATGVILPHGIDDLARHPGWRHVGRRRDTTACACERLRLWWHRAGQRLDPKASAILRRCEGGGRHRGHTPRGKEDLQGVVHDLAVPIRVAHAPADCATGTPIERRLLSHVTKAGQGVLFDALQTVLALRQKTKTHQGLAVTVRVLDQRYAGGRTVSEAFKQNRPIVFAKLLPQWNYWALPQCMQIGMLF